MKLFYFLKFFSAPLICQTVRDLQDSSGAYIKTACTVNLLFTQNAARLYCDTFGMQLFKINNLETERSLLGYADSQWPYARLWVEGGNSNGCTAISNYNNPKFEQVSNTCLSPNYFYCEYRGE